MERNLQEAKRCSQGKTFSNRPSKMNISREMIIMNERMHTVNIIHSEHSFIQRVRKDPLAQIGFGPNSLFVLVPRRRIRIFWINLDFHALRAPAIFNFKITRFTNIVSLGRVGAQSKGENASFPIQHVSQSPPSSNTRKFDNVIFLSNDNGKRKKKFELGTVSN